MSDLDNTQGLPEVEAAPEPDTPRRVLVLVSLAAAVFALLLFAWVAESVRDSDIQNFDLSVRAWVHQFASPQLTRTMFFISFLGQGGLFIAAIVAIVTFLKIRWRRAAVWLAVTLAGATLLDMTLKYAFHRPRPLPFYGVLPHTYSFPSGHSLFSFCFYGVLAGLVTARVRLFALRVAIWICAALLIAAIGLSRIYLGVHYPSDVIAGYLAAALWVSAMISLDRSGIGARARTMRPRAKAEG